MKHNLLITTFLSCIINKFFDAFWPRNSCSAGVIEIIGISGDNDRGMIVKSYPAVIRAVVPALALGGIVIVQEILKWQYV